MPPLNFLKHLRRIPDFLADENDPATLEQVRRSLPPGINGQPNPATLPRPVAPTGQGGGTERRLPPRPDLADYLGPIRPAVQLPEDDESYIREYQRQEDARRVYGGGQAQGIQANVPRPAAPATRPRTVTPEPGQMDAPAGATRPRFADPYNAARHEFTGEHGKRGVKEFFKAGLQGGLESMRTGKGGGFLGAGLGQLIDPEGEAARRFDMTQGRHILADQERTRESEMYGIKKRGEEAQIQADTQRAEAAKRQGMLHNVPQGNTVIDPTGKELYKSPIAPRPVAPKWEWVTGADGKPRQVNVNDPSYKPDGLQPYNKPTAPARPGAVSENAPYLYDSTNGKWIPNPGYRPRETAERESPAQERLRTKDLTGEVSRHNKLRSRVVQLGNALGRMAKTDAEYPNMVDAFNAEKAEYDAESQRLQDTYGDDLENQDSSGAWPLFKVKARANAVLADRPQRANNADAELVKKIQSNPDAFIQKARERGATDEQIQKALRAAGVKR